MSVLVEAAEADHLFDLSGFDLWGYNAAGHYDSRMDRAPFAKSPFPTCPACNEMTCEVMRKA